MRAPKNHRRYALVALRAACLTLFVVPAAAEVVLLRNGAVMTGEVVRTPVQGGQPTLTLRQNGGELRLSERDVAVVVATTLEAYAWQRQQLTASATPEDHLNLAEWAIRHALWPQAARELLDARAMAPGSNRLGMLERRLQMMSQPPPAAPKNQSTGPTDARPPGVSAEAPLDEPVDVPAEEPAPETSLVAPADGLEHFTRRVQPILVNNCTASGCHGETYAGRFLLDRRMLYGYADARSTQQNLRAALASIDADQPEASPLLDAIRGTHAGVITLQGPRADEWRERITAWVADVVAANRPEALVGALAESPAEELSEGVLAESEAVAPGVSAIGEPGADGLGDEEYAPLADLPRAAPKHGAVLTREGPRDEFDPAIFNERHRRPKDDLPPE